MNIHARLNTLSKIMSQNESKQEWNRFVFLISLGITIHALACLPNPKKLNAADYIAVPTFALSTKIAHSLRKKEEKGQNLWNKLQQKTY